MATNEDYEIPESGAVFTFGRSRFAENLSSHFFIRNDPVTEISCGDEHTALVCKSGRVFLFGHNDYGQLGFGHTKVVNKPSCLKYLKPFHSTHVACGKSHTIISTSCARIFTFGCNSDGQLGVGDLNDRVVPQMISTDLTEEDNIVCVAAGCHHSAFLTEKGVVYLWGSNSDGQCSVDECSYIATPQKLEFQDPISSISCGYYHTAFISFGRTYTFGEEDNGKLGRSRKSSKNVPEEVMIEGTCVSVRCGGNHTMVLTESGVVYAFGSNFSGQLGIGNCESECSVPTQVKFPNTNDDNVKVVHMSCGESHSAFVTDTGVLYTCGDARHGKLCNENDSTNYISPTIIPFFDNYFCTSVSCGGCHTMVLAKIRHDENKDATFNQNNREALPPLKTPKKLIEPTETKTDITAETKLDKEDIDNIVSQNGGETEECDSKSNTESNINDELTSHMDEIYTEIEDIVTGKNEEPSKEESMNVKNTNQEKDVVQNDLIVIRTDSALKKFLNVFKRKKSVGAVLLNDSSEDKDDKIHMDESNKPGGQQKSRACIIL